MKFCQQNKKRQTFPFEDQDFREREKKMQLLEIYFKLQIYYNTKQK